MGKKSASQECRDDYPKIPSVVSMYIFLAGFQILFFFKMAETATISRHDIMLDLLNLGASPEVMKYLQEHLSIDLLKEAEEEKLKAEDIKDSLPGFKYNHEASTLSTALGLTRKRFKEYESVQSLIMETFDKSLEELESYKKFCEDIENCLENDDLDMLKNTVMTHERLDGLREDFLQRYGDCESKRIEFIDNILKDNNLNTYEVLLLFFARGSFEVGLIKTIHDKIKPKF